MRVAVLVLLVLAACQSSDVSRALGARCAMSSECEQTCLTSGNWPDGFCTTICASDRECPAGGVCIEEQGGVCAFQCAIDSECVFLGPGYQCKQLDDHGGGLKVMACRGG